MAVVIIAERKVLKKRHGYRGEEAGGQGAGCRGERNLLITFFTQHYLPSALNTLLYRRDLSRLPTQHSALSTLSHPSVRAGKGAGLTATATTCPLRSTCICKGIPIWLFSTSLCTSSILVTGWLLML